MASPARSIPDSAFTVTSTAKSAEPPVELPPDATPEPESDADDSSRSESDAPADPSPDASAAGQALAGRKKSLQARIDELTREKHDSRREADAARAEVAHLRGELDALKAASAPKPDAAPRPNGKPQLADFTDWNDYNEALIDWKAGQREAAWTARQQQAAQHQQTQAAIDHFMAAGTTLHPDFTAKLQALQDRGVTWPPAVTQCLLSHPSGPAIAYQLAQNADEAVRFGQLRDPVTAGVEFGKLLARLEAANSGPASNGKLSTAKPPIKPVGGSPHASDEIRDDWPFEEHFRRMNARDLELRKQGLRRG